jgi:hypothetical protein
MHKIHNYLEDCAALVLVKNDSYWLPYALQSTLGLFSKYIVYDVGSQDGTVDVINRVTQSWPDYIEVATRFLPDCPPSVQGAFRNSMIQEAGTDIYFILDGDEVYSEESKQAIRKDYYDFRSAVTGLSSAHQSPVHYGVCWRQEITRDLKSCLIPTKTHHRFYNHKAGFVGPHPGEAPAIEFSRSNQFYFNKGALCYHFHNTSRSPMDGATHKRATRKDRPTYTSGTEQPIDLLKELPILRTPILDFDVAPELKELQNGIY